MSTLQDALAQKLKDAMKAGDKTAMNTMRALKSALRYKEVELARPLEEGEMIEALRREVRKREEAAAEYRRGGREELAANEDAERTLIEQFLPAMMGEAELEDRIKAVITETGAASKRDMGKVMKILMAELKGRADGKLVNQIVGRLLEQ